MAEKPIPDFLWILLLSRVNGDARHDAEVIRGFCQLHRFSSRQVWDRAIREAKQVTELEPRRVLH